MNGAELYESLWLIGLSLAANGLLWYLVGGWNVKNAKGKTLGPPGSNFEKVEVEGAEAVKLGQRRRKWSRVMFIAGIAALASWVILQTAK
ncbi:MAG: hypothetical protein A2Y64_07165 [Candidatus Coatesbacteria bacterium RBG_13_66_14]|uniref:Uncharacterized protein n=1 Tax=Candidatus Coatesbacteria bacterium RBG_13_66_14 TaxID=1817816 RepID=A0A1F5EVN2_9BACT|nr:MAG: hypothetical protein A2Y64_07165 [Candidatus Coatesbacteria bacterium RBG_13_66_14]